MVFFLPNIKYFRNKIEMQFNSTPFIMKQNNYLRKIVNVYIAYDLDNQSKSLLRNLSLKNGLFGLTNIVKVKGKEKYVYSGYRISFDGKSSWNLNNEYARNVIIFGVDNSSSSSY